jgi:hypothetical protein
MHLRDVVDRQRRIVLSERVANAAADRFDQQGDALGGAWPCA